MLSGTVQPKLPSNMLFERTKHWVIASRSRKVNASICKHAKEFVMTHAAKPTGPDEV